ncbi:MAG: SHOCT domain-containing protein [Oscillospiraceae bacterium]|nr:SHOCT domain-containing protein [Oscillospiraceae bacterium]
MAGVLPIKLLDDGLINQDDFNAKKKQLLGL